MSGLNRLGLGTILLAIFIVLLTMVDLGSAGIVIWVLAMVGLLFLASGSSNRSDDG